MMKVDTGGLVIKMQGGGWSVLLGAIMMLFYFSFGLLRGGGCQDAHKVILR